MLKSLRFLKPALVCLSGANEIKCEIMDDAQWLMLEQIEITLAMIAGWQRILERENYPTGSLVVSVIDAIRAHYVDILRSNDA
jgi:hypothetical protein